MAKVFCPNCSSIANPLHQAGTIGTATGITAGGATVIVGMVRGARAGSALGVAGTAIGAAAGVVLNLLWGITSGGLIGAQAGKLIDENVIGLFLENFSSRHSGRRRPTCLASWCATISQAPVSAESALLGNLAIQRLPSGSSTFAFGRAPPNEEPGAISIDSHFSCSLSDCDSSS